MGNSGAGFTIRSFIRQQIGIPKTLEAILLSANASGDIHLSPDDICPEVFQGLLVSGCFRHESNDVCHRGIHVSCPYGMADSRKLLNHWFVILTGQSLLHWSISLDLHVGIKGRALFAVQVPPLIQKESR